MDAIKQAYARFADRFLRRSRKLTDFVPIAIFITLVLVFFGSAFSTKILQLLGMPEPSEDFTQPTTYLDVVLMYLGFIGIWPAVFLAIVIPPANRRILKDILPNGRGNTLLGILLGIVAGFCFNAVCILLSVLIGDVGLSFAEFDPMKLLPLYGAVLIQSGAEEIMDRQFLYEKLRRRYKSVVFAIIVQAAVFAGMHALNPGMTIFSVTQIVLVGIIFAVFVCYFDSLWAAIFFHTTWNFTQNIIFGCPNSGAVSGYSIFRLDAASLGPFFDPVFGVEGSIGACVILAIFLVLLVVYIKRKGIKPVDRWADLNEPAGDENAPSPSVDAHAGGRHFA